MIVGLMGSNSHILNYTVFGREVNLASRLESVSGHGRIIISESTYAALERADPTLAARCIPQSTVIVKGIRQPVRNYEVPWETESGQAEEWVKSPAPRKEFKGTSAAAMEKASPN